MKYEATAEVKMTCTGTLAHDGHTFCPVLGARHRPTTADAKPVHPAHGPEWALDRLRAWAIGGSAPNENGEAAIERDYQRVRDRLRKEREYYYACIPSYPVAGGIERDACVQRLCLLLADVAAQFDPNAHEPHDCFCLDSKRDWRDFRSSAQALAWVETLVRNALAAVRTP